MTLAFGNDLQQHIETLIGKWERNATCWHADDDVERVRYCPACLNADTNQPEPTSGELIATYDDMHAYQQEIHKAAFKATFAAHSLDVRLLNQPVIKGMGLRPSLRPGVPQDDRRPRHRRHRLNQRSLRRFSIYAQHRGVALLCTTTERPKEQAWHPN